MDPGHLHTQEIFFIYFFSFRLHTEKTVGDPLAKSVCVCKDEPLPAPVMSKLSSLDHHCRERGEKEPECTVRTHLIRSGSGKSGTWPPIRRQRLPTPQITALQTLWRDSDCPSALHLSGYKTLFRWYINSRTCDYTQQEIRFHFLQLLIVDKVN